VIAFGGTHSKNELGNDGYSLSIMQVVHVQWLPASLGLQQLLQSMVVVVHNVDGCHLYCYFNSLSLCGLIYVDCNL